MFRRSSNGSEKKWKVTRPVKPRFWAWSSRPSTVSVGIRAKLERPEASR
jgi:hypothetical protein